MSADDERRVVRYLLGEAAPDERAALEERFFADDDWAAGIQAIEMELIRDYLRGGLGREVRQRFEAHFLGSPPLRAKVEHERALMRAVRPALSARVRRALLFAVNPASLGYAAALASLFAVAWLASENAGLRTELARARQAAAVAPAKAPVFAAFTLVPGTLRGAAEPQHRLAIASDADEVRFQLDYPNASSAAAYRAAVQLVGDGEIASAPATAAKDGLVEVVVPAASFRDGDYILRLAARTASGSYDTVETYAFGVTRP